MCASNVCSGLFLPGFTVKMLGCHPGPLKISFPNFPQKFSFIFHTLVKINDECINFSIGLFPLIYRSHFHSSFPENSQEKKKKTLLFQ